MIRFQNTLTRSLEPFEPLTPGRVGLYTCGPTVYSFAHIGNFRTFVWEDLLRRFLECRGFDVLHVMNLTDVDDKIIKAVVEKQQTIAAFTAPYIEAFHEDVNTLGILPAHHYPRATEHVKEMLNLIRSLRERGIAYESNGSFYYRIARFPAYGRLSGKKLDELRTGASGRVEADEYDAKDDVRDFALWKAAQVGEPSWEGLAGRGRPGWHIECSAMSMKYLGDTFDIHTGGVDNIFPHHENEIAQSHGATGKPLARYWLHASHLVVEGEKMSKSKGNFYTLRDLLGRGHDARTLRYFLLSVHYRRVLDLSEDGLVACREALRRLDDLDSRLAEETASGPDDDTLLTAMAAHQRRFDESLDEDLNAAGALGALFEMVRDLNGALDAGRAGPRAVSAGQRLLGRFNAIFGVQTGRRDEVPARVAALVSARDAARERRDFAESDRLRAEILAAGYVVEDTPRGTRCRRTSTG